MRLRLVILPLLFVWLAAFTCLDTPSLLDNGRLIEAQEVEEGAGARVKRVFPSPGLRHIDPFVILDEFNISPPAGFPPHPHKGFEAVTYMIEGGFKHKDNLGNDSTVLAGGAQRFTAGSGLWHSEMPGTDGTNRGLQLWVNLPQAQKGLSPEYQQIQPDEFPVETKKGVRIVHVAGGKSPLKLRTEVIYQDIILSAKASHKLTVPTEFSGILYLLDGEALLDGEQALRNPQAWLFESGGSLTVSTTEGARLILIAGKPWDEKIRLRGSFVE